jgi:hypothetical protein
LLPVRGETFRKDAPGMVDRAKGQIPKRSGGGAMSGGYDRGDFGRRVEEARRKLPLETLMSQRGKSAGPGGKFKECPYCGKDGAGVRTKDGRQWFKCFHASCPSGTSDKGKSWDEIGFLAHELGISRGDASVQLLKEAGLWVEKDRLPPSVMPGKAGRKKQLPSGDDAAFEKLVLEAMEIIGQGGALPESKNLLQEKMGLSEERAIEVLAELERKEAEYKKRLAATTNLPSSSAGSPEAEGRESGESEPLKSPSPDSEQSPGNASVTQDGEDGVQGATANVPPEGSPTEPAGGTPILTEPPKPPEPPEGDGPGSRGPTAALRWFYRRLHFSEADEQRLWDKRGLLPRTCRLLGYRSNPRSNRDILLAMTEVFPQDVLLESGLWVRSDKAGEDSKPNAQFYGFGIVGKKKKDPAGKKVWRREEEDREQWEWGWTEPVLIPYFDEVGSLVALRPHKGMMKDKTPRLYVVRVGVEKTETGTDAPDAPEAERKIIDDVFDAAERVVTANYNFAVVTEGEFKAAAIWQTYGGGEMIGAQPAPAEPEVTVGALPGISMAKILFGDIEDWLLDAKVRAVVVAYDNEEKSDPKLPGYKEEKSDRFDAEVWARYLGRRLSREGFDAKVAHLPNDWRDERGKADWDGCLSWLVGEEMGQSGSAAPEEVWKRAQKKIRGEFGRVLKDAAPVSRAWQAGFFDSEEERIISNKLERISYESKLPIGGDAEKATVRRLQRLLRTLKNNPDDERLPEDALGLLYVLSKKYQEVDGRYYTLRPPSEKKEGLWQRYLGRASQKDDVEVKRACEVALLGMPKPISDFFMRAHYCLVRLNGKRERIVTLHPVRGKKTELVSLPSDAFAQPSHWREWLLDWSSGASWEAGERELQALHQDVAHQVAFKDVNEVALRGFDENSGLWFYQTGMNGESRPLAYTPEGRELLGDRKGVIWYEGQGYRFAEDEAGRAIDQEGQALCHGEARMHLETEASEVEVRELFLDLAGKMFETIGGGGGYLALGAVLAFGAGPEIFRKYNAFPGLWLHGESNQGKSSVARWLMRLWGFRVDQGVPLPDSTKVGVGIALQQYGNLPVWLEEYQGIARNGCRKKSRACSTGRAGSRRRSMKGTGRSGRT